MKITFKEGFEDNAAFQDYKNEEIARILQCVATKLEDGYTSGVMYDINGNNVGTWEL